MNDCWRRRCIIIVSRKSHWCVNLSQVEADTSIEHVAKEEFDMIVCPGGMPGKLF